MTLDCLSLEIEKKKEGLPIMDVGPHWTEPHDPTPLILRFTTKSYSIIFADDVAYAAGEV